MALGIDIGLGFGRTQGGGVAPVLSDFGAGSIDDLELDPPAIFIEHNTSGTLTGDFHSSATPPAKEAGDIGFFTTSLSGDAVTDISTALNTFFALHPAETGYMHFRLTNGAGDSNVITTQVITTTSAWATVTGTTGSPTLHTDVDGDNLWDAYEFTASGSITLTAGKVGRRLWQGGGGSGGNRRAGSGGGGGWTEQDNTEAEILADTYTVTIGAGGAGVASGDGLDGSATSAMGVSAAGGGGGVSELGFGVSKNGRSGGNGGGATGASDGVSLPAAATGGAGTSGFKGGDTAASMTASAGGGGGGSGGAGADATSGAGGNGGAGIDSDILGTTINFGAGGGGSGNSTSGAAGGASATAGGAGSSNATANRGGGSGGSRTSTASGNGGSGVFIIRIRRI